MSFKRDFNSLLNELLTEYRNAFGGTANITAGHLLYIKAACSASMMWGLYQTINKAAEQMFVSSADRANKERHAAEYGITVTPDMSDAQIIDAVLEAKRSKLSGGNRYDYAAWAREATLDGETITHAMIVPLARGEGTFDVVVVGSEGLGEASEEIRALIHSTIQERRPVGSGFSNCVRVCRVTPNMQNVRVAGSGAALDRDGAIAAITGYINSLLPREPIRRSWISYLMHQYGAEAANVIMPAYDVAPIESTIDGNYGVVRTDSVVVEDM